MSPEIHQPPNQTRKLPEFFNTVTPFSKLLAGLAFIMFPFVGFYIGTEYQKQIIPTQSPILLPQKTKPLFTCSTTLCIEKGVVYYTDKQGNRIIVAESVSESAGIGNFIRYRYAQLSPNQKYISLESSGYENINLGIYDIDTGEIHPVQTSGQVIWLDNGKMLVIGGCGMGYVNCGEILISKNSFQPWVLEPFLTYHFDPEVTFSTDK